jgi:cation transport ATPase
LYHLQFSEGRLAKTEKEYYFVAVTLAITGILNAVWGALFHNCGSVLVVISAFLLLLYKDKN